MENTIDPKSQSVDPNSLVAADETAPPPPAESPGVDPGDLVAGDETAPPEPSAAAPAAPPPPPPAPGRRGQHKKGCTCGRCKWSRPGAPGAVKPAPAGNADFSDLGVDSGAPADFSDLSAPAPEPAPDYDMLAAVSFDMGANTLSMVFGPEWQPQNETERASVIGALKTYFKAKEVKDIPPGMLLAIVLSAYAAPRLRAPSTSSKLAMAWAWFKNKLRRRPALQLAP